MLAASGLTLQMAKGQELRRMAPPSGQKPDPALASLLAQMQKHGHKARVLQHVGEISCVIGVTVIHRRRDGWPRYSIPSTALGKHRLRFEPQRAYQP